MTTHNYNLRKRKVSSESDKELKMPSPKRRKLTNVSEQKNNAEIVNAKSWQTLNYYRKVTLVDEEATHKPDYYDYVSASKLRNHLLNNALVDWLNMYYDRFNPNPNPNPTSISKFPTPQQQTQPSSPSNHGSKGNSGQSHNMFTDTLFKQGNAFEDLVFDDLRNKYDDKVVTVCQNRTDFANRNLTNITEEHMNNGVPFILQAMLCNEDNKTFGVADMLARSDYVNKLTTEPVYTDEEEIISSPKLGSKYHYVVIDIKWSTVPLCANGKTILNSDSFPAYKGQLAIYNLAMGNIQGYIPPKTFILGKSWKCSSKLITGDNYNCYDRMGVIDYEDFDKQYIERTADAVEWIREMRYNGHTWDCHQPDRPELYPNMCTSGDGHWDSIKKQLAKEINELTEIWMVGNRNREYAHDQGIYKWSDKLCSSKTLDMNGHVQAPIVDKIIELNRDGTEIIIPSKIKNNDHKWQSKHELDFYVDFETLNENLRDNNMDITNSKYNTNVIFMIGVGLEVQDSMGMPTFEYRAFTMTKCNQEQECKVIDDFINYITDITKKYNKKHNTKDKPKMFHWGNAEFTCLINASKRHGNKWNDWIYNGVTMIDFCKICTYEPIIVKGMLKFKLKDVARAMYDNRLITTRYSESGIYDGLSATIHAIKYYNAIDNNHTNFGLDNVMVNITEYNYVDCRVVWEIVNYLREHNI